MLRGQDDVPLFSRSLYIDDPLIAATAKAKGKISLGFYESSVDEDIAQGKKPFNSGGFCGHLQQFLVGISGEDGDVQTAFFHFLGKRKKGLRLAKRFSAGEGDPGEKRVLSDFSHDGRNLGVLSLSEGMSLRVMATGAAVGAALVVNGKANSRAVYDGLPDDACQVQCLRLIHHAGPVFP